MYITDIGHYSAIIISVFLREESEKKVFKKKEYFFLYEPRVPFYHLSLPSQQ